VLTASISRRAGGLFGALPPLVRGIEGAGCDVGVFSIGSTHEGIADHWRNVTLNTHACRGPKAFSYAPELSRAVDAAALDLVHTHGLWTYPSVVAARWSARWTRPRVVSPHGMLDPWALRNSAWKKQIAGWLYENRHLREAACLHALTTAEHAAIRAIGLTNPVAIIPNGIDLPTADTSDGTPEWALDLDQNDRLMLYLGRLHPKKGLENLIRAWAQVQHISERDAARWHLVIAGWDEGGHETRLKGMAEGLGLGGKVRFVGPQFDARKAASLARADALVLPSLSEGLPMAILEAWAYSLPVVMTQACNLPEGFAAGAAAEIEAEAAPMAEALSAFFALGDEERLAMGRRGRLLVEERFAWPFIAERMAQVYRWLVIGGNPPDCVALK
jgi:glycosyltransferase involved in cell wall biosynthesis